MNCDGRTNSDGRAWFGIAIGVRWLWNVDPLPAGRGIGGLGRVLGIRFGGRVDPWLSEISLPAGSGFLELRS